MSKICIVTGASRGLGRGIALTLAREEGCKVYATARNGEALNALAERLSPRGVRLVLMLPTPEFPYNVLLCAPQWYRPSPSDMCAVKRAHFLQLRAPIYQRVQRALSPLIARYDPMDALCDQALCSMLDGAQLPLYMDTNHLSRHGALTLAPSMLTWMRAQLNLGQK